jgi:SAM-dependent methyltransferase
MASYSEISGNSFRFERTDGHLLGIITLNNDGTVAGINSFNEKFWAVEGDHLVLKNARREVTTRFDEVVRNEHPYDFIGTFVPDNKRRWHRISSLLAESKLVDDIRTVMFGRQGDAFDILKCAELAAAFDSANYYSTYMAQAKPYGDKFSLLTDAMNKRSVDGLILELGVFQGATINHIARLTPEKVYGFDVFTGLPEAWRPGFQKGAFVLDKLPQVLPNVELVVGLFEKTLGPFIKDKNADISFMHVDCDLYSATKTIFNELGHKIVPGTVIVFDEYFNYPGWREHEVKAFEEFVRPNNREFKFLSFVKNHQQVAIQIVR